MGRRRGGAPPISLFSFQDIITSVTGIMILVTLMMAVELAMRPQKTKAVVPMSTAHVEVLRTTMAEAAKEVEQLRARHERGTQALKEVAAISASELQAEARELERILERLQREANELEQKKQDVQNRKEAADKNKVDREADRRKTDELVEKIKEMEEQLAKLKQQNRVVYNPAPGSSKSAWLVEIAGNRVLAAELEKPEKPQVFDQPTRLADFLAWARGRDRRREYFVLLVKPSGIEAFTQIHVQLKQAGFDLGFDLLSAEQSAIDPQAEAKAP